MSNFQLHLKFKYSNKDDSNFRNCIDPRYSQKLIQTKLSKVEIILTNESNLNFPGGTLSDVWLSPVSNSNALFKINDPVSIPILKPNEMASIEMPEFITYHSGHCYISSNIHVKGAPLAVVDIYATTEILNRKKQVVLNNGFIVGTIIEDDSMLSERESSIRNSFVAFVALFVAIASFFQDFLSRP